MIKWALILLMNGQSQVLGIYSNASECEDMKRQLQYQSTMAVMYCKQTL